MLTAVTMRLLYFTNPLRVEFSIFNLDYQVTQSGGGRVPPAPRELIWMDT